MRSARACHHGCFPNANLWGLRPFLALLWLLCCSMPGTFDFWRDEPWQAVTGMAVAAADAAVPAAPIATVYDGVIDDKTAEWLHEECTHWNQKTKAHASGKNDDGTQEPPNPRDIVFGFPLEHPERFGPIPRFLNGLVGQLVTKERDNEASKEHRSPNHEYYVEYWTRQEWHHILAHQDMDEGWERSLREMRNECQQNASAATNCTTLSGFRHPLWGHVLYLQIGSDVRGPTVVFDASRGSDLVTKTQSSNITGEETNRMMKTTLVSVPAVAGRLLRFPGDKLHAVPRPADVYWTLDQSEEHRLHHPPERYQRSVLLFNLWDRPLAGKFLDCGAGSFVALDEGGTCGTLQRSNQPPRPVASPACQPHTEWKPVPIAHSNGVPPAAPTQEPPPGLWEALWEWLTGPPPPEEAFFQVPLSGDVYRRGLPGYVARMKSWSWWDTSDGNGDGQKHHPARDMVNEPRRPVSTDVFADERFWIVEDDPRHRPKGEL